MIYAVLLCDKQWMIKKIQRCKPELSLEVGACLTDVVEDAEELLSNDEKQYSMPLTFTENNITLSALVRRFDQGNLVTLSRVQSDEDFIEFANEYPDLLEWAENRLEGFYHSEYFQIQKLNNQLIDSQRALVRSNMNLELALKENKRINEKISAARQAAEQANQFKTQFLANMSHDIRTPMNAIVGLTKLMEHNINDPEILSGYIHKLQSSGEYLLGLINDILDLSKIESGSMELRKEPMNLKDLVEKIAVIIQQQAAAKEQKFKISLGKISHEDVLGDTVRLRQVLMNLLSNSVKYTQAGGEIYLRVEELEDRGESSDYRFVVEDTGMGMTEEFLKHIFEPFARARVLENEIQGTGLGMAITKSIVDAMKGSINIKSEVGKGSQFEVVFSFDRDMDAAERRKREAETKNFGSMAAETGSEKGDSVLKGMNFLCAEDNELNAEILKSMLELKGASCRVCPNGKLVVEAFEEAKPGEYDAILMDVQMPVMNGYDAAGKIRGGTSPLAKTIPIIAMTANAFAEDVKRSLDAGMNAHVTKPIDLGLLEEEIRKQKKDKGEKVNEFIMDGLRNRI